MIGSILLVEDNELIQQNNKAILERNGYTVRLAMSLAQARAELAPFSPDAMVLDITLPDGSGLEFLQELRRTSQMPVLLLTARNTAGDTTAGLDAGGDDYLAKPYDMGEFRARVDALMRRAARVPETVTKGPLTLSPVANQAFLSGADLRLTQKEFALLLIFVQSEDYPLGMEYLYEKVWKAPLSNDSNALKNTIARLRPKLKDSGYHIDWSRGEGYRFERE